MNVSVNWKGWNAKSLRHDNARRLVTNTCERFEEFPIGNDFTPTIQNLLSHPLEILCLRRSKSNLTNNLTNLVNLEFRHPCRLISHCKQSRRDLIHFLVRSLCRQHHRNKQSVRVVMVERDWRSRIQFVQLNTDSICPFRSSHH